MQHIIICHLTWLCTCGKEQHNGGFMKIYLEDLETEIEEKDCDINKGRIVCVGFNEKNEPTLVYQLFTK